MIGCCTCYNLAVYPRAAEFCLSLYPDVQIPDVDITQHLAISMNSELPRIQTLFKWARSTVKGAQMDLL